MAHTIAVGPLRIITSGYGEQVRAKMAEDALDLQLVLARAAYESGQRLGLRDALALLRTHRPEAPLPDWVLDGVHRELSPADRAARRNEGGRLSNERTRRSQRLVDHIRTMCINAFLNEGLGHNAACRRASQELRGKVDGLQIGGSTRVFELTYARFYRLLGRRPEEFYPLFLHGFQLLELWSHTPAGGVGEKMFRLGLNERAADLKTAAAVMAPPKE